MSNTPERLRQRAIRRIQGELESSGFPRLKMLLIVGLTGGAGFLASYLLLQSGMLNMTLRYPLAVGVAYLVFLLLLWLWLRTKAEDYSDLPSPDLPSGRASGEACSPSVDIGGAGESSALGDVAEAVSGADELAIPLLGLLLVAALVFASGWIIYSAPLLFAELLVDGVLSASLYRRIKGLSASTDTPHWLMTALRRTFWPFALTALTCAIAGAVMHGLAPEAHSIGGFLHRGA